MHGAGVTVIIKTHATFWNIILTQELRKNEITFNQ